MKRLETLILRQVDDLIQHVISLSLLEGPSREEQFQRCCRLVKEMGGLLLEVLEGREEHLQALLEQLVAQRLPDKRLLKSFGSFNQDLQQIIAQGVRLYLSGGESKENVEHELTCEQETEKTAKTEEVTVPSELAEEKTTAEVTPPVLVAPTGRSQPAEEIAPEASPPDPEEATIQALRRALQQAFPGEEIVTSYPLRGGPLLFYLPRLKLGFELRRNDRREWRRQYFCQQEGIELIGIEKESLNQPHIMVRELKRRTMKKS